MPTVNLDLAAFEAWLVFKRGAWIGRSLACATNPLANFVRDQYPDLTNVSVTEAYLWWGGNGHPPQKIPLPLWARRLVKEMERMPEIQKFGINRTIPQHQIMNELRRIKGIFAR